MTKYPPSHSSKKSHYNSTKLSPLMKKHKLKTNVIDTFERTMYLAVLLSFVKTTSQMESLLSSSQTSVTHQDIKQMVQNALPIN